MDDQERLINILPNYYRKLYPYDLIAKWLTYGKAPNESLSNREIAFILQDEIHLRYLSFNTAEEFREKIQTRTPNKIDIGSIYNRPPSDRKKVGDFFPTERELVFDIDLTDYDSIRSCCSGTNVCSICWRWIVISVKVLDKLLRGNFGFKLILWVFSGRRGIHCWVADDIARKIQNRGREAIARYLTFNRSRSAIAINKNRVHPVFEEAYRTIMDSGDFDYLVLKQKWFDSQENWADILNLCDDTNTRKMLDNELNTLNTAELRWESLKLRFDDVARSKSTKLKPPPLLTEYPAKHFLRLFVLTYAYPRLDEKVSTGITHLLKSPFSAHPKNGNIAVPLNPKIIDHFQLSQVPNISKLMIEITRINEKNTGIDQRELRKLYYKHTSLAPFIEIFNVFLENIAAEREN